MRIHSLLLYAIQVFIYTLLLYLFRDLIINKDVFQLSFGEQLDDSMIAHVYRMHEEYAYLQYALIPLSVLFKIMATAVCLYIRCFFISLKVKFSMLIRMGLWAEFVFIGMELFRYFHLKGQSGMLSLEYAQWFNPMSLLNLFEPGEIAFWYVYPLKTCNAFELIYIILLAILAHKMFKWKKMEALETVLLSYGVGLFLWVVMISFLTLNLV